VISEHALAASAVDARTLLLQGTTWSRAVRLLIVSWMSGNGDTRPAVGACDVLSGFGWSGQSVRRRSGTRPKVDVRDVVSGFGQRRPSVPRPDTRPGRRAARRSPRPRSLRADRVALHRATVQLSMCATSSLASASVGRAYCDRAPSESRCARRRLWLRPGAIERTVTGHPSVSCGARPPPRLSGCGGANVSRRPGTRPRVDVRASSSGFGRPTSSVPRPGSPSGSRGARRVLWHVSCRRAPIVSRRPGTRPRVDVRESSSGFGRMASSVPRPGYRPECEVRDALRGFGCGGLIASR